MVKIRYLPLYVYIVGAAIIFVLAVLLPEAQASTLRRFEVIGDGPQDVTQYPAQSKSGLEVLGPGRYGVVAEKCEVDPFVGLACYGPAVDGQRLVIAHWHTSHWWFYRELGDGEVWGEGLGAVFEP